MLDTAATHSTYSYPRHQAASSSSSFFPCKSLPLQRWKRALKPSRRIETIRSLSLRALAASTSDAACVSSSPALSESFDRTLGGQVPQRESNGENRRIKRRVFFLDVNGIYYKNGTPNLRSFADWISLFVSQVSLSSPVIAVIDGEGGNEHRRQLLPSYKAHRNKYTSTSQRFPRVPVEKSHRLVIDFLSKCGMPVVKVEGHEADDVVATLVEELLDRRYKAVIASPDKDFKQLISEDVQLAIPMSDLGRWSIYTMRHYLSQYGCDPQSDLSLRCIIGDKADGVPGIQTFVPAFGRNTALKLLKKHSSLDNLLHTAAVRTVAKKYAQDALIKYADHLRKNYVVLALRRDVDVHLRDEWLSERDTSYDMTAISDLYKLLGQNQNPNDRWTYQS